MDFGKQNETLLIKQLHKFYNKADVPWVQLVWNYYTDEVPHVAKLCGSFWSRDIMKLADKYREICTVTPVKGDSILFWLTVGGEELSTLNSQGCILLCCIKMFP
jgi:hypothetical protein